GPEKIAARERLRASGAWNAPVRVFVGRDRSKAAVVDLTDPQGKTRARLLVDSLGAARLEFLDAGGHVVYAVPESTRSRCLSVEPSRSWSVAGRRPASTASSAPPPSGPGSRPSTCSGCATGSSGSCRATSST